MKPTYLHAFSIHASLGCVLSIFLSDEPKRLRTTYIKFPKKTPISPAVVGQLVEYPPTEYPWNTDVVYAMG